MAVKSRGSNTHVGRVLNKMSAVSEMKIIPPCLVRDFAVMTQRGKKSSVRSNNRGRLTIIPSASFVYHNYH